MYSIVLFCLIGIAFANENAGNSYFQLSESQWQGPETPETGRLGLSSGASLVVPNLRTDFSCLGRAYGYYADVNTDCLLFHICHPSVNALQEPVYYHYTNFCPNLTRFDQRKLICLDILNPDILPCPLSVNFYPSTEQKFNELSVQQTLLPGTSEHQTILDNQEILFPQQKPIIEKPLGNNFVTRPIVLQTVVPTNQILNATKTVLRAEQPFSYNIKSPVSRSHVVSVQQVRTIEQPVKGNILQTGQQVFPHNTVRNFPGQQKLPLAPGFSQSAQQQQLPQQFSQQFPVAPVQQPIQSSPQFNQPLIQQSVPQSLQSFQQNQPINPQLSQRVYQPIQRIYSVPQTIVRYNSPVTVVRPAALYPDGYVPVVNSQVPVVNPQVPIAQNQQFNPQLTFRQFEQRHEVY